MKVARIEEYRPVQSLDCAGFMLTCVANVDFGVFRRLKSALLRPFARFIHPIVRN